MDNLPQPLHERAAEFAESLYRGTRPLHEQAALFGENVRLPENLRPMVSTLVCVILCYTCSGYSPACKELMMRTSLFCSWTPADMQQPSRFLEAWTASRRQSVRSLLSSEELCSKCSCVLQLEELQKVKIPTSIKVTPTRGGLLDIWD